MLSYFRCNGDAQLNFRGRRKTSETSSFVATCKLKYCTKTLILLQVNYCKMDDLLIDLNLDQIQRDYPVTCLPSSLNKRSGKANKCLYEELDLKLYEPAAKMVAFHTAINRIQPWLKTLDIFYYDNLGKEGSNYSVQWEDDPINWTDRNDANNKVTIQLHTLKD